jgi:hypothetical protein
MHLLMCLVMTIVRMRLGLRSSTMHRKWCNKHLHDHTNVNTRIRVSIVLTSCRRSSLGRRMYCTAPRIDGWIFLDLFRRYGLVFGCYIVMEYCYLCLDATLWLKFVDLLFFVPNYVSMLVLKNWLCWCVKNLFWLQLVRPEFQQHMGGWTSHARLSDATKSCHTLGLHKKLQPSRARLDGTTRSPSRANWYGATGPKLFV